MPRKAWVWGLGNICPHVKRELGPLGTVSSKFPRFRRQPLNRGITALHAIRLILEQKDDQAPTHTPRLPPVGPQQCLLRQAVKERTLFVRRKPEATRRPANRGWRQDATRDSAW